MAAVLLAGQAPPESRKKLLAIGEEKGYRHEAVSHALATVERLGRETRLWDTYIRTDTEQEFPQILAADWGKARSFSGLRRL